MAKKRRHNMSKTKGGNFERKICVMLSQWWGGRDDIFWRTAGSGARATTRFKRGGKTSGSEGDICAIHPSGNKFLKHYLVELKCGYDKETIADCMDHQKVKACPKIELWIRKAKRDAIRNGKTNWMLIHQRTRRRALLYVSTRLYSLMMVDNNPILFINIGKLRVTCVRLEDWIKNVTKQDILGIL